MSKIILALETSSKICGVSIIEGENVLSSVDELAPREHNERLPELINRALIDANKPIHDVQAIAVSIGPGSFTGLRIGLGFSKGLAYAKGLPIIPVPTLLSLAFSQKEFEPKNGIMHSHAKKVFYQAFYWDNKIPKIKSEVVVAGIDQYLEDKGLGFHSNCGIFFNSNNSIQEANHSARHIGILASMFFDEWLIDKPYDLEPDYIAPFEIKQRV